MNATGLHVLIWSQGVVMALMTGLARHKMSRKEQDCLSALVSEAELNG